MRVDVVHVGRGQSGVGEGNLHASPGTLPVLRRRRHVVGVAVQAEARQLGVDPRPSCRGMLVGLQDDHTRTVREDESVPVPVPGAAGPLRLLVTARERPRGGEPRETEGTAGHLGTARDHHVHVTVSDEPAGVPDVVGAAGAGTHDAVIRALDSVADREVAGNHVDDVARHEEGRDLPRPAIQERLIALLDPGQPPDARADGDPYPLGVRLGDLQPRVRDGLHSRRDAVVDEGVHLLHVLGRDVTARLEPLQGAGDPNGERRRVEMGDGGNTALAREDARPGLRHVESHRRHDANSCNDDASGQCLGPARAAPRIRGARSGQRRAALRAQPM